MVFQVEIKGLDSNNVNQQALVKNLNIVFTDTNIKYFKRYNNENRKAIIEGSIYLLEILQERYDIEPISIFLIVIANDDKDLIDSIRRIGKKEKQKEERKTL